MLASTKVIQGFVKGAAITMGSTLISCTLAIQVEKTGHQFLFWMKPELYANVDQAYGLTEAQLMSVRRRKSGKTIQMMEDGVGPGRSAVDIFCDASESTKMPPKGEWNTFQQENWLGGSDFSSETQKKTTNNLNYPLADMAISKQDVFACSMTA